MRKEEWRKEEEKRQKRELWHLKTDATLTLAAAPRNILCFATRSSSSRSSFRSVKISARFFSSFFASSSFFCLRSSLLTKTFLAAASFSCFLADRLAYAAALRTRVIFFILECILTSRLR